MSNRPLTIPEGAELSGPCLIKTLISDRLIARVLGKQPPSLTSIASQYRVTLKVSGNGSFFPGSNDRVTLLSGEANNVESALKAILTAIHSLSAPQEPIGMAVLVPNSSLINVTGPSGEIAKNLATASCASIKVHPRVEGYPERIISVTSKVGAQAIVTCIAAIVETAGPSSPNMSYDHKTPSAPGVFPNGISVEPEIENDSTPSTPAEEHTPLPLDEIKIDCDQAIGDSSELQCKICHTFILGCAPKLTRCGHSFCGDCFEQWSSVQPKLQSWAFIAKSAGQVKNVPCPVCKTQLNDKSDVFPVFSGREDCQPIARALNRLLVKCHNNHAMTPGGSCEWSGLYPEYQTHAKNCSKNPAGKVAVENTLAVNSKTENKNMEITAVIPFTAHEQYTISVDFEDRLIVEEKSDNSFWLYGKNSTTGAEGWFPDYCTKKYSAYYEQEASAENRQVERCAVLKDFFSTAENCLSVKEGEVVIMLQRFNKGGKFPGWSLVVSSDGMRQGWVPENRCKTIREGSDSLASSADAKPIATNNATTHVARRAFDSEGRVSELSISVGDIVSIRKTHESGWSLGVVVANGSKKEGWFPDWVVDRLGKCCNCGVECVAVGLVKIPGKGAEPSTQGPVCSGTCWEKWIKRSSRV